jgi:hypothetical protein
MAEHGTPDQISSQAPFIQALVQKSVTAHHQPCRPAFIPDAKGKSRHRARGLAQIVGTKVAKKNRAPIHHRGTEKPKESKNTPGNRFKRSEIFAFLCSLCLCVSVVKKSSTSVADG